jgi:hypothetical protein
MEQAEPRTAGDRELPNVSMPILQSRFRGMPAEVTPPAVLYKIEPDLVGKHALARGEL